MQEIKINTEGSAMNNLAQLIRVTSQAKYNPALLSTIVDTDQDGANTLMNMVDSGHIWVHKSLNALGHLLVNANHDEISSETLENVGYMVMGLSELGEAIENASVYVHNTQIALATSVNNQGARG